MLNGLSERRQSLTRAWEQFVVHGVADGVTNVVRSSWQRSTSRLGSPVQAAPSDDDATVAEAWQRSPLRAAVLAAADDVTRTAESSDLVAAVTDESGRILWTAGGTYMRDRAAAVNFAPGGRWDEASVGTNALDLALRTGRTETVFSAEHFSPMVHSWVCYAAPLRDRDTGEVLGVLDLSTTWERSHPMAAAAVTAFARGISTELSGRRPTSTPAAAPTDADALTLGVLGQLQVQAGGTPLLLTRRQAEILLALAVHPAGLTLDQVQAYVWGDEPVAPSTVKAEISRLRRAVGSLLLSRPYRLSVPVCCDALDVLRFLERGDVLAAVRAYTGSVLPHSDAPVARELAVRLDTALRTVVLHRPDVTAAVTLAERMPDDVEVLEHALSLVEPGSTAHARVAGMLAAFLQPDAT